MNDEQIYGSPDDIAGGVRRTLGMVTNAEAQVASLKSCAKAGFLTLQKACPHTTDRGAPPSMFKYYCGCDPGAPWFCYIERCPLIHKDV